MRLKGTNEQFAERKARGLALLVEGKTPKEVAEILEVTKRSVDRWQEETKKPRKKAGRPAGRPRKLSAQQMKRLEKALDQGAYAFGYAGDYWTLDRIAQVIWQLFRIRYETSAVWHVMQRMGWSNQRPQRQPFHRDEETIEQWKEEELPRIKTCRQLGATLVLEDESGFSLVSPLKRTWSRRGQTPIQRTSIDHHQRLNLLGAMLVSPKGKRIRLSIRSYWHSLTGKEVIAFLQQILDRVPVLSSWSGIAIRSTSVRWFRFLATQKRLHMFYFPVAAPELNPAEFIWTQATEYTAGTAPHNGKELQTIVCQAIARTRVSQHRLHDCLLGTHLHWID
jgi:transposase